MSKLEFKGPFLGFKFKGTHSSDLDIVRINTGNRDEMSLSPDFKDSTIDIPGADGSYYFNTQVGNRDFSINFAYDSLDEVGVKKLRDLFGPRVLGSLAFDETPYKEYTAKVTSSPKLAYIAFDQGETHRMYKGEGAIGLTAFYPYARAPYKTLDQYTADGHDVTEWGAASRILTRALYEGFYDTSLDPVSLYTECNLYNAGELSSPLSFTFTISERTGTAPIYFSISYVHGSKTVKTIFDTSLLQDDIIYTFNSKLKLLTDSNSNIYNHAIIAGDFINIESTVSNETHKLILSSPDCRIKIEDIKYDYLYL